MERWINRAYIYSVVVKNENQLLKPGTTDAFCISSMSFKTINGLLLKIMEQMVLLAGCRIHFIICRGIRPLQKRSVLGMVLNYI